MTTIPRDWDHWLTQTTPDEVAVDLAEGAPDIWLRHWRAILDRMIPGDELWKYCATEYRDTVEAAAEEFVGFEQILDAEILERIGLLEPWERISCIRFGFALVREDEVVDWIESPL